MTREEAVKYFKRHLDLYCVDGISREAEEIAIQALSQEPCDDAVSRKDIQDYIAKYLSQYLYEDVRQAVEAIDTYIGDMPSVTQKPIECDDAISREAAIEAVKQAIYNHDSAIMRLTELPSVTQKSGKCKECKYFEYDSVAKVDGVPLIVAHEICNKWGGGCKTSEDGYCYLFEPQESEVRNEKG